MTKRITITVVAILLGANLFFAAKIYSEAASRADRENPYEQMKLFTDVMEMIRGQYVDADKVAYTNLTYGALRGMLNSLDPHSQFMDPQGYQDMRDGKNIRGTFNGLVHDIDFGGEGPINGKFQAIVE